ncbi:DUF6502 family protein [Aquabacterium sp. CECT 9606]|uniref:DUF6502 family protein n=1 Tax=Aquabacterium sp. CECT 9606 TaxID=2845822 RepID=UPI001E567415|nr:DUF6502 family protein [Aquabacterium sp. CECT 9606]CAH0348407.1 hypothetical protein AQB9606_00546 [Aquabacterium sp. CECT 9606]
MSEQDPSNAVPAALSALLLPLARLAVSQGVPLAVAEAALKRAFVSAARDALVEAGLPEHRLVSRISTTTGLNRREVTRLTQSEPSQQKPVAVSSAGEVFTRWVTDKSLRTRQGTAKALARVGPAPSFEALARSVTQDVHPRSLLDELCRLGIAQLNPQSDTVSLLRDAFVPGDDQQHMLAFLADNVGDHLNGAVSNVIGQGEPPHFDQAVFADELSSESMALVRQFVSSQWQRLLNEAVPLLEQCIENDRQAERQQDQRVRIGLYSYVDDMATPKNESRTRKDHE